MVTAKIRAVYEDGVLKPLEPVDLVEHQEVVVSIEATPLKKNIVQLGGSWEAYVHEEDISYESIESALDEAKEAWLTRLFNQVDGKFDE